MDKVNKNIRALYTPFWVWTLRKRRQMESKTLETFSISSEKFSVKENDDNAPPPPIPSDPWYQASYMGWVYSGIIILIVVIILYAIWFQQLSLWFQICCLIFAIVFGPIGGVVAIVLLALYHTGVISK